MADSSIEEKVKIDFSKGKVGKLFFAVFFPTLVGMIFNSVLTVIDGIFVGKGVGANGIAAVNIVAPLFMLAIGVGLMLGIGASVIGGIKIAEKDNCEASHTMTIAFIAGTLVMLFLICLGMLWPYATLDMLGCSEGLQKNAYAYMMPLLPGLLFLLFQCVGMMLIRLDGSPKYAMWCQAIPATINIVLDYLMVFPWGMGVAGAAWATSISCALGGIMVLFYFVGYSEKLKFRKPHLTKGSAQRGLRVLMNISTIGLATFITEVAFGIMMYVGNMAFMRWEGDDGVAAYSVACYLFPVVFSFANAVAQSAQPVISVNYGLDAFSRVRAVLKVALATAIVCGIFVLTGLWSGDELVVNAFLFSGEKPFELAVDGLPLFALCAVPFAINITFIGYYQSIERPWLSIFYTLLRGIIFMAAGFIVLPGLMGVEGLWLAIPSSEFLTCAIILGLYLFKKVSLQNHIQE